MVLNTIIPIFLQFVKECSDEFSCETIDEKCLKMVYSAWNACSSRINKEMQVKNMIGQSDPTRDQTAPLKIGGLSDMSNQYVFNDRLPLAPLKIAALESCRDLAQKVNDHIVNFRRNDTEELIRRQGNLQYRGYDVDSYLLDCACPRFGSGEAKGIVNESVRGTDIFCMVDVTNHSLTYKMSGYVNHMSPDDHYQDLKRIIGATASTAHRINVIMPFLYESRQHKRTHRESLDCAMALEELVSMGVSNIITFDAHDPRVQNAIPLSGLDNFMPTYQFVKALFKHDNTLKIDKRCHIAALYRLKVAANGIAFCELRETHRVLVLHYHVDVRNAFCAQAKCPHTRARVMTLGPLAAQLIAYLNRRAGCREQNHHCHTL